MTGISKIIRTLYNGGSLFSFIRYGDFGEERFDVFFDMLFAVFYLRRNIEDDVVKSYRILKALKNRKIGSLRKIRIW